MLGMSIDKYIVRVSIETRVRYRQIYPVLGLESAGLSKIHSVFELDIGISFQKYHSTDNSSSSLRLTC